MKTKKIKSAAILTLLLLIGISVTTKTLNAQVSTGKVYIKIKVDGLSCPFCAYGMEKKLKEIAGSENVFIKLTEGEATLDVPKTQKPTEDKLREVIEDAGFSAREIIFSYKPFKDKYNE